MKITEKHDSLKGYPENHTLYWFIPPRFQNSTKFHETDLFYQIEVADNVSVFGLSRLGLPTYLFTVILEFLDHQLASFKFYFFSIFVQQPIYLGFFNIFTFLFFWFILYGQIHNIALVGDWDSFNEALSLKFSIRSDLVCLTS